SSAAVDFLLLDRPIAFLLPDVEEYGANRGFVFEPIRDWLPGVEVDSFAGFLAFIQEIAAGTDSSGNKRRELRKRMHAFQDNQSCSRILRALGIEEGEKRDGF
ncbi:MAG: CDP-glycerol glycerophosphotransferase family protein, partial [Oscillospiraceae bacterium]|nr:CDP-glycerol glycerophosphotransferase family protein [Oscillospiraceae bacterium]